ncbi:MAG: hypothetical protein WCF16_10585 [Alphaproteobacteria bacterium]
MAIFSAARLYATVPTAGENPPSGDHALTQWSFVTGNRACPARLVLPFPAMYTLASLVAVLVIASLGTPAFAQDNQSGPTDADLRAGYCLSVAKDVLAETQACQQAAALAGADTEPGKLLGQTFKKLCDQQQSNIARLKSYLVARGYLVGPNDPLPILLAGRRGDDDFNACGNDADAKACSDKCWAARAETDAVACAMACPVPDACKRTWPCNDLDFLPF